MFGKLNSIVASAMQSLQPTQAAIQQELDAYQRDKNPDHLFKVINLQQAIIEHRSSMLCVSSQIGSIMEGALKGLDPNTSGPKVTDEVMRSIKNMLGQVGSVPAPALSSPNPIDQLQAQRLMQKEQELFQQITQIIQRQGDMAKAAIQNIR